MRVCRQGKAGETTFPSYKLESCEHYQQLDLDVFLPDILKPLHNLLVHVEVADKEVKADASKKQPVA
jgi:hypothetical protein